MDEAAAEHLSRRPPGRRGQPGLVPAVCPDAERLLVAAEPGVERSALRVPPVQRERPVRLAQRWRLLPVARSVRSPAVLRPAPQQEPGPLPPVQPQPSLLPAQPQPSWPPLSSLLSSSRGAVRSPASP